MKKFLLGFAVAVAGSFALFADDALAVSADFRFSVDTGGGPYVVKTLDGVALPYRVAESVTAAADGSAVATLVDDADEAGSYTWIPSAGGLWTITNSYGGAAAFYVRHSLFPGQQSPATILDDEELADMISAGTASSGFEFSLGGVATLLGLETPAGWMLRGVSEGVYRLVASQSGTYYVSDAVPFAVDSDRPGPDRRAKTKSVLQVAYSGYNWTRSVTTNATLVFTSPSGVATTNELSGTGTFAFRPMESGAWTVALESPIQTLVGRLWVSGWGMMVEIH